MASATAAATSPWVSGPMRGSSQARRLRTEQATKREAAVQA